MQLPPPPLSPLASSSTLSCLLPLLQPTLHYPPLLQASVPFLPSVCLSAPFPPPFPSLCRSIPVPLLLAPAAHPLRPLATAHRSPPPSPCYSLAPSPLPPLAAVRHEPIPNTSSTSQRAGASYQQSKSAFQHCHYGNLILQCFHHWGRMLWVLDAHIFP